MCSVLLRYVRSLLAASGRWALVLASEAWLLSLAMASEGATAHPLQHSFEQGDEEAVWGSSHHNLLAWGPFPPSGEGQPIAMATHQHDGLVSCVRCFSLVGSRGALRMTLTQR